MSSHPSQSRGDLGFIPNNRIYPPNRTFFGAPGNPSKKGVALYGPLSKMTNGDVADAGVPKAELTGEKMVSKRTDWLEGQERKLTATVNEQRSEQQRIAEQLAASLGNIDLVSKETKRLNAAHEKNTQKTQQLYEDLQWVYGKTSRPLMGIECSNDKIFKTLHNYRKNPAGMDLIEVAKRGRWVLLSYPMERVDTETGYQFLMKAKNVHQKTGQISVSWAIVFEDANEKEHRAIEEFATWPH